MKRKEFHELASIERAEQILKSIISRSVTVVLLDLAHHRVLAEDVFAPIDVPSFDRADMDGYAVRAEDTYTAREEAPVELKLIGRIPAGDAPTLTIGAGAGAGTCVAAEISTGAMLPDGADAVVMVEYTDEVGSSVLIQRAVHPLENVMRAGTDIRRGTRVLLQGTLIGAREIGVLAAIGVSQVCVRSLAVGIVSTGDELVPVGERMEHGRGKVYDVNAHTIAAAVRECGATPVMYGIIPDDREKTIEILKKAISECDLILTSGSTSAGSGDIMPRILEECGEVLLHGINIKPGKPMIIAKMEKPVIGLPGFPTSALSMFYFLVAPRLRDLLASEAATTTTTATTAVTASAPASASGREQVVLGSRIQSAGRHQLLPVAVVRGFAYPIIKGSGAITALAAADGFIEILPEVEIIEPGETVEVVLFGGGSGSGSGSTNDFVIVGMPCDDLNSLIAMLPFRVRVINTGVAAGTYAVRNGIADVAGIPLRADELPDPGSGSGDIDDLSVVEWFSHGNGRGEVGCENGGEAIADAATYSFIVLRNRVDSDRIRTFLSMASSVGRREGE